MKILRPLRVMLLALLVSLIPASSYAGVFISVGFAPPMLPIYDQPPCPDAGLIWTPGYWDYGPDGYYWVPGAWVPAPFIGALWTPPYWGWDSGLYMFHPGYWGSSVGYYGGVNYGFGYFGVGFFGGRWSGRDFMYNTAVWNVDRGRVRSTYNDRGNWDRYTVGRGSRASYSGGPGGIRYSPSREERQASSGRRMGETSAQRSLQSSARGDRSSYFRNNQGRPSNPAFARPRGGESPGRGSGNGQPNVRGNENRGPGNAQPNRGAQPNRNVQPNRGNNQSRPSPQVRQAPQSRPSPEVRQAPQNRPSQQRLERNAPQQQSQPSPQVRQAPQSRPVPQSRPAPEFRQAPQSRPAPEVRQAPQRAPQQQSRPAPQQRGDRQGGDRNGGSDSRDRGR